MIPELYGKKVLDIGCGMEQHALQYSKKNALNALKAQGINKVNLVVFAHNDKGNAFWEKMGFTQRPDLIYRHRTLVDMVRIDT